ncbi:MAG TPA: radical SAM protein [Verrucomicrobiae bacterium]|nr:radical SAM protein [Verrucomicrobiae bacterium]
MKVFFLNIPFHERYSRESRSPGVAPSGTLYYPIYLALAAGVTRKGGHTIDFLDAPADRYDLEQTKTRIKAFKPDLIVATTVTASVCHDVKVMDDLAEATGAMTMLCGTHATARPTETLQMSQRLDFVAVGEYDFTILAVADHFASGKTRGQLSEVLGLAYRHNGQFYRNADRPMWEKMDEIPWASLIYKDFLKIENYSYGAQLHPEITIVGGRGCPYQCTYCVFPQTITGQRYRARSVKDVVDEMEFIVKTWPHNKEVMFEDDTMTLDKQRMREISEEILRRGLKVTWSGNARADFDDVELLKIMKKAGCRLFCVGFESSDPELLKKMMKGGATVKMQERFVEACKKAGVLVHGCFLLGGVGETKATMKNTLEIAKKYNCDTAQFFPMMVYPGTRAYEEAKKRGDLKTENYEGWLKDSGYYMSQVNRTDFTNDELTAFCDHALKEFYFRPQYLLSKIKQFFLEPRERSRIVKGGLYFVQKLAAMHSSKNKCSAVPETGNSQDHDRPVPLAS